MRLRAVKHAGGGLFVGFFLMLCLPLAGQAEIRSDNGLKRGTIELGLQSGYWQATTAIGDAQSANRSALFVLPQLGYVFTDRLGTNFLSGVFEVLVEPVGAHFFQPFSATLVGGSLVVRYNFLAFGRWMPYWDFGAGMGWTDLAPRIPEESVPFEFLLEMGPGLKFFVTEQTALSLGVRFHHISNAGIGERNTGLNAVLGLLGFSYYFSD